METNDDGEFLEDLSVLLKKYSELFISDKLTGVLYRKILHNNFEYHQYVEELKNSMVDQLEE